MSSNECKEKIDKNKILNMKNEAPLFIRYLWVKFHLIFLCGRCSQGTQKLRDIYDEGECWWWKKWRNGDYSIPFWMGREEHKRLSAIRKQKLIEGKEFPHIGSLESAICNTLKCLIKSKK